jgi:HD superfamily phosphodiesterase
MDGVFLQIFDLARPFLDTRENEEHTRIACDFAVRLLHEEGGDPDVIFPAVILHDVGWKSIPEELQLTAFGPYQKDAQLNRVHEREGARIAGEILQTVSYPRHLVGEITAIVLGHDSRRLAISINDAIVKDADKLTRFSDHGFRLNVKRFGMTRLQYLDRLQSKIDEWFLTLTGKRMAAEELRLRERSLEFE